MNARIPEEPQLPTAPPTERLEAAPSVPAEPKPAVAPEPATTPVDETTPDAAPAETPALVDPEPETAVLAEALGTSEPETSAIPENRDPEAGSAAGATLLIDSAEPQRRLDSSDTSAVRLHGVVKLFGGRTALDGIDLDVPAGTVFGLIGPNGAGKTTTMRLLLDIVRPSAGRVEVLGESPRVSGKRLRRRIGYLPGELVLDARISARRLLRNYADLSGPVPQGRIEELADRLGLELDRTVKSLSKGNKQKLGLIQAFMHEPELLVLDEPTSGLDPLLQRIFLDLLREARQRGQTVLLSSHVLSEIQHVADDVAILRDGRIVRVDSVQSLRAAAPRRIRVRVPGDAKELMRLLRANGATGTWEREIRHGSSSELRGSWKGEVGALLGALSSVPVLDLAIEEPELEDAVLDLYGTRAAPAEARSSGAAPADVPGTFPRIIPTQEADRAH